MGILSRFRVYIIMIALFSAILGIFYWYYQDSQKALKQYAENQSKLETALQSQIAATEKLKQDIVLMQKLQQELQTKFDQSRDLTKSLELLFNKDADGNIRDFGELSSKNPDLVTEELNRGTREVFECFELLSNGENNNGGKDDKTYIDCFPDSN